jgi:hypothetical protein
MAGYARTLKNDFPEIFAMALSIKEVTFKKRNAVGCKFGRRGPTNQFKPGLSSTAG